MYAWGVRYPRIAYTRHTYTLQTYAYTPETNTCAPNPPPQVGPGVSHLEAGDVVLPMAPLMGTWRSIAVWPARDLLRVPLEVGLPAEYLAMSQELCLAYALLEQHGDLKASARYACVGLACLNNCMFE